MWAQCRKQPPFWEVGATYLLGERRATASVMAICVTFIFLVTSLAVGIYHVLRSILLPLLSG